jgi:hypothetical protein
VSISLEAIDQAMADVARTCTGLRSALLGVDLVDEMRAVHDLEDDLMAKLDAMRQKAEQS